MASMKRARTSGVKRAGSRDSMRRMEAIRLDVAPHASGMTSIRRAALRRTLAILFAGALLTPTAASGAVVPANINLGLTSVVTGLSEPLLVTPAGGGAGA